MSDRYTIHVAGLEGKEITSLSLDRKKTRVSTSDNRDFFRKGNMPADVLKQIVDSLPDEVACSHRIEVHDNLVFERDNVLAAKPKVSLLAPNVS